MAFVLTDPQRNIVERPAQGRLFLEGPAGSGKTTAGVARLLHLLDQGVPGGSILLVVPQRTLAVPYYDALRRPTIDAGGQVDIFTIGGLAQRMVDLFWPLIAAEAGFAHPHQPPTFLTLETAQYYMARLVRPLLDEGYFETVTIDRNRLYSQILDNLNKAAVVGFPHTEIGQRLKAAWGGEQAQRRIYDEAQACATRFRQHCLAHNLLDFSLQVEVFIQHLWPKPICRDYLLETYVHLLVDNVEEDTPVAHDVLRTWLPHAESALVIADRDAGYRRFLGADPASAYALAEQCDETISFEASHVTAPALQALGQRLASHIDPDAEAETDAGTVPATAVRAALAYEYHRYHPQMLDWVADQIADLVHGDGVAPGEIVVLAPFLSDALRFSLTNRLKLRDVPARSHRPSRALRDEPATRCLLTLAAVAHPDWGFCPTRFDVAYALMQAIADMDLVRAQLLAEIVYRIQDGVPHLTSFERINPEMQARLTFVLGNRYEHLRNWIAGYAATTEDELDHFLARLFGEVLSQPGYGFHADYDAGEVAANLIESVQKFRWVAAQDEDDQPLGQEYVTMVQDGVVAAQYIRSWRLRPEDAVLLAPAYTFLMSNRPVDVQFWLDVGSRGWWERLYQPLTHPYVLSRRWPREAVWTDTHEVAARQEALYRLALGLIRRCRRRVFLGLSQLGEQGYEQKGPLLQAFQRVLRRLPDRSDADGFGSM
ncbi:MAG: hypothetical protein PVI59_07185 [Anaerolineae bacterium]|jgi:hypothetical protein